MTMAQILTCNEFHFGTCGKKTVKVRRNGKTQTWKRTPDKFRIPAKFGLGTYVQLTNSNMDEWHCGSDCPLKENR